MRVEAQGHGVIPPKLRALEPAFADDRLQAPFLFFPYEPRCGFLSPLPSLPAGPGRILLPAAGFGPV